MFLEIVSGERQHLAKNIGRYLLTIIIVAVSYVIGQVPLTIVILMKTQDPEVIKKFAEKIDFSLLGINSNVGLLLVILFFVFSLAGLLLAVKFIHHKKIKSIITAAPKIRWQRIIFAFILWMLLSALVEVYSYFTQPENYEINFNLSLFIPLILIALFLLPIQTSFEEIFIRGYLMQGIGLIGVYRFVPLLITSSLFGLMHIMNPEIENFGLEIMMAFYISFGLFLGIITLMDDGLEIPLGIHAANNIYATIFVSYSGGALQTAAIFKVTTLDQSVMLAVFVIMAAVFLIIVSRKYHWTNWDKLFKRINFGDNDLNNSGSTSIASME